MDKELWLSIKEREEMLPDFDQVVLFNLERRYLDIVNVQDLELSVDSEPGVYDYRTCLRMLKIDEVTHEGESQIGLHLLNMQNVLAAMKDDTHNVVSVIRGTEEKTHLYYGLSKRLGNSAEGESTSTDKYNEVLKQALHGNFLGVKVSSLRSEKIFENILDPMLEYSDICAFPGIPSLRLKDPKGPYVQGIDRFIEGMRGEEYCLITIAEPIPLQEIDTVIGNLFELGTRIHSEVKATGQKTQGVSNTINVGLFGMGASNEAKTEGDNYVGEGAKVMAEKKSLFSFLGACIGGGLGIVGGPAGIAVGASIGASLGSSIGEAAGISDLLSKSTGFARSVAKSVSKTEGKTSGGGLQAGYARGWNRSKTVTQEMLNKTAEHCENLCNAYIERLQAGKNLGFWNVGVYLLSNSRYTQLKAQGLLRAAFSGDVTYWEPIRTVKMHHNVISKYILKFTNPQYDLFLYGEDYKGVQETLTFAERLNSYAKSIGKGVNNLLAIFNKNKGDKSDDDAIILLEKIRKHPVEVSKEDFDKAWKAVKQAELGHPFGKTMGGVSTPMNMEELSIIMNVPRQEVQGVTIREAAPFGINYVPSSSDDGIDIGKVVHKRTPMDTIPYVIPRELFKKHAFVCGVTGSGKTNTCFALLRKMDLPFMVIEPAKTEYRQMLNFMPDLQIFTPGSEMVSPFRINPFEFSPGSELLTHIDSIKAVFSAAFPMYASMPYILEEAIIEIYRDKGWDLAASTNRYLKNLKSEEFFDYLPTLQDLYDKIEPIVKRKAYAQEQTMNIQAALLARLSSLLTGSKGLMLNTRRSTPIEELLKRHVVLELKNIGDDDEKCFMMGLILSAIYQYRENSSGLGSDLKHILLIEEAHRLLRRTAEFVSPEIGNSRGKAVETFTNVISEIREYGQGVIIVDQIPAKLTPDVVKNTNIKIIHRTLAQDDRDYVGSTMNLTEAQNRELCLLEVGRAVVHMEGADKAFLVQVTNTKGDLKNITNEEIRQHMSAFHDAYPMVFARYPGFEKMDGIAEAYTKEDFSSYSPEVFFGVMGALVVMMAEPEALGQYKEKFHDLLSRKFSADDDLRRACYLIHYANLLFAKLNESFPGCYDQCVFLQRLFVDAWFDGADASGIAKAITHITGVESPFVAFFYKYVKEKAVEKEAYFKTLKTDDFNPHTIETPIISLLNNMLLGIKLTRKAEVNLSIQLLEVLVNNNPQETDILKIFRTHYENAR